MKIQVWFPSGFTGLIFLQARGLSKVFSSTTVWKHQLSSNQSSLWPNSHICIWFKKSYFLYVYDFKKHISYYSLLFSETLRLDGCIFPFLLCLLLLFFTQLFERPPQTTTLTSCISFSLGWFCSSPTIQSYEPPSIVLQALCLPDLLNLFFTSIV